MRKTGRTKALLAMFLAAASLQAGTAFGAQAATGSQLQAGTWVKEDAGWKYRKPSGEMATGWVHTASGWYYLQPETGIMATVTMTAMIFLRSPMIWIHLSVQSLQPVIMSKRKNAAKKL